MNISLSIQPFIYVTGLIVLIAVIIIGYNYRNKRQKKETRSRSAKEVHGEISRKILSDPKLVDRYFGSPTNCTRSASRHS